MKLGTTDKDVPYRGVDSKVEDRPGVPRDSAPHLLPGARPETPQQIADEPVLVRAGLDRPTPVWSSDLPPRGVSGALRRAAYQLPDHRLGHWVLLMAADRIDVLESLFPAPVRAVFAAFGGPR